MDLQLNGKTALVTGSTGGIGYAIAEHLAREGAIVFINGRSEKRVDEAISKLKKTGIKSDVGGIVADLSSNSGVESLYQNLPSVDILINNLGIYEVKPFEQITDEDWLKIFEANVLSGIRLSRFYLPKMKPRNWGRVIFISSESALNTPVEMIHYGMTKTAQLAVARGLAESVSGTGITVNSVLPGPTRSEGVEAFVSQTAKMQGVDEDYVEREFFKTVRPSSIIKRFATPDEVAALVVFVCSPLASAITGASLRVDGGCVSTIA